MEDILNELQEQSDYGKKDFSQTLNLNFKDKNIINFQTISGTNIYAVYNPITTTLGKLKESLFDNYTSYLSQDNIMLYSEQLKKVLNFDECTKLVSEYKFDRISTIRLM